MTAPASAAPSAARPALRAPLLEVRDLVKYFPVRKGLLERVVANVNEIGRAHV